MPPKRKAQSAPAAPESPSKRVTRADVASGSAPEPADITNVEDTSPIRKKRRGIDNESNNEPAEEPEKPEPKRAYSRRATKPVARAELDVALVPRTDTDGKPDVDEPKLKIHAIECENDDDTPRRSRRHVVFDSVELPPTPKRTKRSTVVEREASPTPTPVTPRSSMKKSKTKPKPSLSSEHPVSTPIKSKVDMASNPYTKPGTPLPERLPMHLPKYLNLQKRAILDAFSDAPLLDHHSETSEDNDSEPGANIIALQQLRDLLGGSIERGEGNSCLMIGPAGSGKSKVRCSVESHIIVKTHVYFADFRNRFD